MLPEELEISSGRGAESQSFILRGLGQPEWTVVDANTRVLTVRDVVSVYEHTSAARETVAGAETVTLSLRCVCGTTWDDVMEFVIEGAHGTRYAHRVHPDTDTAATDLVVFADGVAVVDGVYPV